MNVLEKAELIVDLLTSGKVIFVRNNHSHSKTNHIVKSGTGDDITVWCEDRNLRRGGTRYKNRSLWKTIKPQSKICHNCLQKLNKEKKADWEAMNE